MKLTITTLILIMFITTTAIGETINPVTNFIPIEDFPDTITSGTQHQIIYTFSTTHNINLAINFSITHPDIEYDEWNINYILNSNPITPHETSPGNFSNETSLPIGNYELITTFKSLPNIVPGTYEFKSWLTYNGIEVVSTTKKSSSGSTRHYTTTTTSTPTSTLTPTPTATVKQTITAEQIINNNTTKNINIPEQPLEPSNKNWLIYIALVSLIVTLLASIYYKKRKTNNN